MNDDLSTLGRFGDTSKEALAARLQAAREATGLSIKDAATQSGIEPGSYLKMEQRGSVNISVLRFFYTHHGIDYNFFFIGAIDNTPASLRAKLATALAEPSPRRDQKGS